MPDDVAALILAGGKATRFGGISKHELVIEGRSIFARQVAVLAPRVVEILVSGVEISGYRKVIDRVANAGPLAGIAAGLAETTADWLVVVAGDMPYLTPALIDSLIANRSPEVDAVGVRIAERTEPLCSLWSVRARAQVERSLAAGQWSVGRVLEDLSTRWVTDADPRALRNLNSPSDFPE